MNSLSDLHVLLLVLDSGQRVRQLVDHLLELVVIGGRVGARARLSAGQVRLGHVHREHDDLGRHGAHLVAEAVLVNAVGVRGECVLAVGLAVALVDHLVVRSGDLDVNVEEAALDHLEHEAELGAGDGAVEEALLRVGVYGDEILVRDVDEQAQLNKCQQDFIIQHFLLLKILFLLVISRGKKC